MSVLDQKYQGAAAFPSFYFTSYTLKHKNITNTHTKYEEFPLTIQIFRNPNSKILYQLETYEEHLFLLMRNYSQKVGH